MRRIHRRSNNSKVVIISVLLVITLCFTIAYSAFSTSLSINTQGNVKEMTASKYLKTKVVTSGDGLYHDLTEDKRYVFKGKKPANFIKLGNDMYRIISIEPDNSLKIIYNGSITQTKYDNAMRYQNYNGYCNNKNDGCNIWSSINTTYKADGITRTDSSYRKVGEENEYLLPTDESTINVYLNSTWFTSLYDNVKQLILNHNFYIGPVSKAEGYSLKDNYSQEKAYIWKGNIGLMSITDYLKANSNSLEQCQSLYEQINNNYCLDYSKENNWLYTSTISYYYFAWTINPVSMDNSGYVYNIYGGEQDDNTYTGYSRAVHNNGVSPVFYLRQNIKLSGSGSESDPYIPTLIE